MKVCLNLKKKLNCARTHIASKNNNKCVVIQELEITQLYQILRSNKGQNFMILVATYLNKNFVNYGWVKKKFTTLKVPTAKKRTSQ